MPMSLVESLKVLHGARTDEVVMTTMGSAREWMRLGSHPLDFVYAPSAMGELPALALGVALAQPLRKVIACNGDGCMLMNLGCLITIAAQKPANLVLIVFDNGVYEVTGQQELPAPSGSVDLPAIARGCGWDSVYAFDSVDRWRTEIASVLAVPGPTFVVLKVEPVPGGEVPRSPAPAGQRVLDFAARLQEPARPRP